MKISKITSAAIISFGLSGSLYADIPPIDKYDTLNDPKYQHIRDFYAFGLTSTYDYPRDTNFWAQKINAFIDNKINSGTNLSEAELTQTINDFINIYPKLNITIEQIQSQIDKYADIIANNPAYSDLKSFGEALIYYQNARSNPSGNQGWNASAAMHMMKFIEAHFVGSTTAYYAGGPKIGTMQKYFDRVEYYKNNGTIGPETVNIVMELAQEIFTTAIKELQTLEANSINNSLEALKLNTNINSIISLSKNALDARVVALLNPNNSSSMALASAIKNLDGVEFASCDDEALACVIRDYTKRFETNNNLWANILGAKAYLKNSPDTDIYGFIIGYDHAFDSDIVGAFFSYAKAKSDGNNITNNSDNYQFGIYSKSFFGNFELDSKIYYGIGKSDYSRSVLNSYYSADYDTSFAGIELEYGYVFAVDTLFIKPLIGLNYNYIKTKDFNERGDILTLHYNKSTNKNATAKLGVELRKYYDEYSYFYFKPALERDIYKSGTDSVVNFIGSEYSIINQPDEKKHTYINTTLGTEISLNSSFSINANIGAKLRSDEKIYNGTLGVKYKY